MRIAEGGEGFEVVTLDEDMVGSIGRIADDGTIGDLFQYRQLGEHSLLSVLGLVLPYETILLLRAEQLQQLRLLLIRKSLQFIYLPCEFMFVHKRSK